LQLASVVSAEPAAKERGEVRIPLSKYFALYTY
jgi:hypothetical protein